MTSERDIRDLLRHTWHPFFGRFGRLRPIQLAAIPPVAEGRDVLVGAPTASGKTEALLAPLVERMFRAIGRSSGQTRASTGLRILVVSPTRALCRDLDRRLRRPLRDCGLDGDVKTGDSSPVDLESSPPNVLVTTPESLDSLLCRRPKSLRRVSALVLDELHLLDGTARGDQLRCVTTRLDRVAEEKPQRCGASATLPNGETLARRYLGPSSQFVQPSTDDDSGQRAVDAELLDAATQSDAARAIHGIFDRGEDRKLLVFANTRSQVEDLTAELSDYESLRDRVHAHHGSLSRAERLRAEEQLRNAPSGICVASMTLEVGIDVGDVDRAILVGPPPNVSSLLQRIGRSNRDEDVTRVTCLHSGTFEKLRTMHLLERASVGELFDEQLPFRPSLIAQQGLSLMFQNPDNWIAPGPLHDRLPPGAREQWGRTDCEAVLEGLEDDDFFHPMEGGRYTPDEEALHQYEYGKLHSNIENDDEVEVVDALTRQVIGRVRFFQSHKEKLHSGEDLALSLGGEKRKVVRYEDDHLVVRSEDGTEDAQFIASLPPRYSRDLAADFAEFLGLAPQTMLLEERGERWLLYHFMGTVWGRLLEHVLRARGFMGKRGSRGAFFFELREPLDSFDREFSSPEALESAVDEAVGDNVEKLARLLGSGPFARWVPRDLQEKWVRRAVRPRQWRETVAHTEIRHGALDDLAPSGPSD